MYSISNLEGTYTDLTDWFNEVLKGDKTEITRYELINFLNTKGRVPLGIMKKNKPPRTEQPKCIARILKDHTQCKNDSEQGDNCFCKVHTIRPSKYTMDDTLEDIELAMEEDRRVKKEASKARKAKKKAERKAAKESDESNSESGSSSGESEPKKEKRVVKRKKRIARKARFVPDTDEDEEIDFGEEKEETPKVVTKKVVRKAKKIVEESDDEEIDFGEEDSLPPTQDNEYDEIDFGNE
jgi:hypothetical protein